MSADTPPLSAEAFASALDPLGPFEPAPVLAVAVSGGADSLALLLLSAAWAAERGGSVVALTVDHGLRAESAAEAREMAALCARRGIAHHTLVWNGPRPERGVQAAAREARYGLMLDWCAGSGVLHLLTAHHRDDQAETLLQRLARGSGTDGLSAMVPLSPRPQARLLRPLLGVGKATLYATVAAAGLSWVEDPTNRSSAYERGRQRQAGLPDGLSAESLARSAARLGSDRVLLDAMTADLLVTALTRVGEGWLEADRSVLAAASRRLAGRALARMAAHVAGSAWMPDPDEMVGLLGMLETVPAGGRLSRAGCLWRPVSGGAGIVICRECRGLERRPVPLEPDVPLLWDGRYRVVVRRSGLAVCALGEGRWQRLAEEGAGKDLARMPHGARLAFPVVLVSPAEGAENGRDWLILAVSSADHGRYAGAAAGGGADGADGTDWDVSVTHAPRMSLIPTAASI